MAGWKLVKRVSIMERLQTSGHSLTGHWPQKKEHIAIFAIYERCVCVCICTWSRSRFQSSLSAAKLVLRNTREMMQPFNQSIVHLDFYGRIRRFRSNFPIPPKVVMILRTNPTYMVKPVQVSTTLEDCAVDVWISWALRKKWSCTVKQIVHICGLQACYPIRC